MTKFKYELRKYPWPRSSAIRALAKRWLDDERADDVWQKVTEAARANLTTEEFIRFVIRAAMAARALPARIESSKLNDRAVIAGQRGRVAEAFASIESPFKIADILEDAAWELRFRKKFDMLLLDGCTAGARSRRQDKQHRRGFSLAMSDFFQERCGKWMDGETGILLEIMFGRQNRQADSSQEARDYRKSRQASGRLDRLKPV